MKKEGRRLWVLSLVSLIPLGTAKGLPLRQVPEENETRERLKPLHARDVQHLPVLLVDLLDDLLQDPVRFLKGDLTGAHPAVSAASVLQHQLPHIHRSRPIQDTVAHGKNAILPVFAVKKAHRDVLFRIERVNDVPVAQ